MLTAALSRGDAPAVIDGGQRCSYATLASLVDACAAQFEAHRLGPIVGLSLVNSIDLVVSVLALRQLGSTVVLLPPKTPAASVALAADTLPLSGCIASVSRDGAAPAIAALAAAGSPSVMDGPSMPLQLVRLTPSARRSSACSSTPAHAAAICKVTSGSSGQPKLVLVAEAALDAEARQIGASLSLGPGDRVMAGVSMLHSYGFDLGLVAPLTAGAAIVIARHFSPAVLHDIAAAAATVFLGTPRIYEVLLARSTPPVWTVPPRYLLSCTGPLTRETIARFTGEIGATLCQHYGASETGGLATLQPQDVASHPGSVGCALPGVSLSMAAPGGVMASSGEGMVFVRSAALASGYANAVPPATVDGHALGFVDGGFQTADRGCLDDGYLTLYPRNHDSRGKYDLLEH